MSILLFYCHDYAVHCGLIHHHCDKYFFFLRKSSSVSSKGLYPMGNLVCVFTGPSWWHFILFTTSSSNFHFYMKAFLFPGHLSMFFIVLLPPSVFQILRFTSILFLVFLWESKRIISSSHMPSSALNGWWVSNCFSSHILWLSST